MASTSRSESSLTPPPSDVPDRGPQSLKYAKGKTSLVISPSLVHKVDFAVPTQLRSANVRKKRKIDHVAGALKQRSKRARDEEDEEEDMTTLPDSTVPSSSRKGEHTSAAEDADDDEMLTSVPTSDEITAVAPRIRQKIEKGRVYQKKDEHDTYPAGTLGEFISYDQLGSIDEGRSVGKTYVLSIVECKTEQLILTVFSFPFFPAEIIDPVIEAADLPPDVLKNRSTSEVQNMARGARTWLVRFFDAQASYGWIPMARLDMLGEDDGTFAVGT